MLIALYTSQRTYFDRLLNYYNQFGNDISGWFLHTDSTQH